MNSYSIPTPFATFWNEYNIKKLLPLIKKKIKKVNVNKKYCKRSMD